MKPRRTKSDAQKYRSRQRKYRLGAPVLCLDEITECLRRGKWIMWNRRPMHPEVVRSMTLRSLERGILRGVVHRAEIVEQGKPMTLPFDREFIEAMQ